VARLDRLQALGGLLLGLGAEDGLLGRLLPGLGDVSNAVLDQCLGVPLPAGVLEQLLVLYVGAQQRRGHSVLGLNDLVVAALAPPTSGLGLDGGFDGDIAGGPLDLVLEGLAVDLDADVGVDALAGQPGRGLQADRQGADVDVDADVGGHALADLIDRRAQLGLGQTVLGLELQADLGVDALGELVDDLP
jgi:hypothetical protein